jgi:hypothetical protein
MLCTGLLALLLAAPLAQADGRVVIRSAEGIVLAEGERVGGLRHGRWRHRHPTGELAAVGPYKAGQRAGTWTFTRPDGSKLATGKFDAGVPTGRWQVFGADGSLDRDTSGVCEGFDTTVPGSALRAVGQRLDGELDGPLVVLWPDGAAFLALNFERGTLVGEPTVTTPAGEAWRMRGEREARVARDLARDHGFDDDGLPRARHELLDLATPTASSWSGTARFPDPALATLGLSLVERVLDAPQPADADTLLDSLGDAAPAVLAAALEELAALPAGAPLTARLRLVIARIVEPLTPGVELGFAAQEADTVAPLAVARAVTVLALCGDRPGYFELDARLAPARRPLAAAFGGRVLRLPFERWFPDEAPRRDTSGSGAVNVWGSGVGDARATKDLSTRWRASLDWLAGAQRPDGLWDAASPNAHREAVGHELGVTALAMRALAASDAPEHRSAVVRAARALLAAQEPSGRFARTHDVNGMPFLPFGRMYDHAIATEALAHVCVRRGSLALESAVCAAAEHLWRAKNPYGGFGYEETANGEQTTSVTYWGVHGLVTAERAGWRPPSEWRAGVEGMVQVLTDPSSGRVGYKTIGSPSARAAANKDFTIVGVEALTGAGIALMREAAAPETALKFATRALPPAREVITGL